MTERAEFERLALPHMDAAYTLAFWLLRSRPDAEDAVQDAYLRAFRAVRNVQGDIRPWLLKIVRNVALRKLSERARTANVIPFDAARSDRLGSERGALQVAADAPSAEDVAVEAGEQAMVRAALAELAPTFREALVLREIEALSYREIAGLTGVPIGTVMSRLARARAELRKVLARMMRRGESDAV
ncbi:MAG TPA: sigma-70 family RNA polymerase sigma factor [Hyphomicrobiaceae bacterium]|jgi:RNA polymerase sigma-70 factor, ECF subfamily|nr:sigma-70 family RNA polymerase sigma factor [Hyphomicrobiaceae bacterium]